MHHVTEGQRSLWNDLTLADARHPMTRDEEYLFYEVVCHSFPEMPSPVFPHVFSPV